MVAELNTEVPCPLCSLEEVHIVIQRKPLRSFPMPQWVKLALRGCYEFMRWVNSRYGFAVADDGDAPKTDFYSIELKAAHPDAVDAWHDANCDGGAVKRVPWRASLPPGTCQFGSEEWPALDGRTRSQYKQRQIEIVSLKLSDMRRLEAKIDQVARSASV